VKTGQFNHLKSIKRLWLAVEDPELQIYEI